ncbi:uncharacterized protein HMPREF1541_00980 [Cyphellophora europaea CBS 101466]|uniref:Clr5 domain-containing protein n=1 Tax=Cyphellophora europaea (strain CBS 101466) TaxID=1220924 RepID=W2SDI2_CYPE1|nr:uncharacterized protein HMPREF1541_00980 [Cyphellophora europaea CBS 101466]ETN46791.1 hypothetical protein HMPREF1541_00980 [Cyphellophora europaea CBS 101466]
MASGDELGEIDPKQHEDYEWEAQRENFLRYYKDENRTLKQATQCMVDNHGFYATPRQWERKISLWKINKYTPRSERIQQIENQGRTLVEVAQQGRRPRKYSNTASLAVDDRNFRRFARRELSRSPSTSRARSRSSSAGQQSASPGLSPRTEHHADDLVFEDRSYDMDFASLVHNPDQTSIPAVLTNQDTDNPQAHVLGIQDAHTGQQHTEVLVAFPKSGHSRSATPAPSSMNTVPYEQFPAFGDMLSSNEDMGASMNSLHVNTGLAQDDMFMIQHNDAMDLSPTHTQDTSGCWPAASQTISPEDIDPSFGSTMQAIQSFDQASTGRIHSNEFPPAMSGSASPIPPSAILIVPPEAESSSPNPRSPAVGEKVGFVPVSLNNDLGLPDPYPDFSQHVHNYDINIRETISSVMSSGQPLENVFQQLNYHRKSPRGFPGLALILPLEATFFGQMNTTLNNLVSSAQRLVMDTHQRNLALRQQNASLRGIGKFWRQRVRPRA